MNPLEMLVRLKDDYARVAGATKLDLRIVEITYADRLADEATFREVEAALTGDKASGWVRLRSEIFGSWWGSCPSFADAGPPLAAEWRVDADTSVHLRGDPTKTGLILTTYRERPARAGDVIGADEVPALRQIVTVLRHPLAEKTTCQNQLVYHVFWGAPPDDPSAVRRLFSRFAGFDERDCGIEEENAR